MNKRNAQTIIRAYPSSFPRFARYGPEDRYFSAPGAGICISVFAIARRGKKLLAGLPNLDHSKWEREWFPNVRAYSAADRKAYSETLQVPCTYLREGEHPEDALDRVLRAQVCATDYEERALDVGSYTHPSTWYPKNRHWDLVFTYEVDATLPARARPWWSELGWFDASKLRAADFGWNGDLMRDLGIVKK